MLRSLLNRAAMGRSGAAFQAKSDSGDRRPCPRLLAALPDDANPPPKKKKQRQGMDELLDFMIAGPKLRKWYGESDEIEAAGGGGGGGGGGDFDGLPRDRGEAATTEGAAAAATSTSSSPPPSIPSSSSALPPAPEGTRDAVVVVSADGGPVAEAVLLQLILATGEAEEDLGFFGEEGEAGLFDDELLLLPPENSENDDDDDFEPAIDFPEPRPKTFLVPLVKDREAALSSFGKYAVPVDERDGKGVQEALKRARAVVVAGGGWEKVLELLPLLLREGSSAASAPAPRARLAGGSPVAAVDSSLVRPPSDVPPSAQLAAMCRL